MISHKQATGLQGKGELLPSAAPQGPTPQLQHALRATPVMQRLVEQYEFGLEDNDLIDWLVGQQIVDALGATMMAERLGQRRVEFSPAGSGTARRPQPQHRRTGIFIGYR